MLTIDKKVETGKALLMPKGRLDMLTAQEMKDAVDAVLPEAKELIFDFKDLEYISSAGLRVLMSAYKAMNMQGEMKLCNVNETIMEILEVTGFSDVLTIE